MFKTRLLSGIVLVILALFLIISGHEILLFATLAISCIGMFELYRVFKMEKTVLAAHAKARRAVFDNANRASSRAERARCSRERRRD